MSGIFRRGISAAQVSALALLHPLLSVTAATPAHAQVFFGFRTVDGGVRVLDGDVCQEAGAGGIVVRGPSDGDCGDFGFSPDALYAGFVGAQTVIGSNGDVTVGGSLSVNGVITGTTFVTDNAFFDETITLGGLADSTVLTSRFLTVDAAGNVSASGAPVVSAVTVPGSGGVGGVVINNNGVTIGQTTFIDATTGTITVNSSGPANKQTVLDATNGNVAFGGDLLVKNANSIINFGGNRIQNVGAPEDATDAATKGYVDNGLAAVDDRLDVIDGNNPNRSVSIGQTNAALAGLDAIQVGTNAQATGANAIAVGTGAAAAGFASLSAGFGAGLNSTGNRNTAVGAEAGQNVTGNQNAAFGQGAGFFVTGSDNAAFGTNAGRDVLGGANMAVGFNAGQSVTGSQNNATGAFAGTTVRGSGNSATGRSAGTVVTGNDNTANGTSAGSRVTGDRNVAFGANAGQNVGATGATASDNIAIGTGAGSGTFDNRLIANNAISIGTNAQASANNATAIGAGARATRANQVSIGTAANQYTFAGLPGDVSRSFQSGPLEVVTTDANGNLASDGGSIFRRLDGLAQTDRELAEGIALSAALSNPIFQPGQTFAMNFGFGNFEGETGLGFTAAGVVDRGSFGQNSAVTVYGGVGAGTSQNTVLTKGGVTIGW